MYHCCILCLPYSLFCLFSLHRREKGDRTSTPRTMTPDEELGLALQVSRHAPRRPATQSHPGKSGLQGSSVQGSSVRRSSVQGSYGKECSQGWHPMPSPGGWSEQTFPNVTPWQSHDVTWMRQYQQRQRQQQPFHPPPQQQQQFHDPSYMNISNTSLASFSNITSFQASTPNTTGDNFRLSQVFSADDSLLNTPQPAVFFIINWYNT